MLALTLHSLANRGITFEGARCLRRSCGGDSCSACVGACPVGAITADRRRIAFDANMCESCGACRAVCPTEAFTLRNPGLIQSIRAVDESEVTIGCTLGSNPGGASVPCFSILTSGEILYVLAEKETLEFCVGGCSDCRFAGEGLAAFRSAIAAAKSVLCDETRLLLSGTPTLAGLSRRSFLRRLTERARTAVSETLLPTSGRRQDDVSLRRRSLSLGLSAAGVDRDGASGLDRLVASSSCSGCGACASACPFSALEVRGDTLSWGADACLNCGTCAAACPERALSFGEPMSVRQAFGTEVLAGFEGVRCRCCGAYFDGDGAMCPTCGDKESLYRVQGFNLNVC